MRGLNAPVFKEYFRYIANRRCQQIGVELRYPGASNPLTEAHMHKLTEFRADNDYTLWLRFDDGIEGTVFLGNMLEIGAFKLWRDREQFRRVAIDPTARTLVWEGGIELDPAVLYRDLMERKAA